MPVNRAVRRLKRQLVDEAPGKALIDPPVFTLDDFLLRLYTKLPRPRKVLQPEVVLFFIEDILQKEADVFSYLLPEKKVTAGLVKKTADMVAEFRRFGYDSEKFSVKAEEAQEADRQKYHDFEKLIARLEERFGREYIDEPFARHNAALRLNREWFGRLFPTVKEIYINGYGLFTPAMYRFIEKTAHWLPVNIKLEYCASNPVLFQQTAEAVQRFKAMGATFVQKEKDTLLALRLFNNENAAAAGDKKRSSPAIRVRGLINRREEVEYIARYIRDLRRSNGIPLHRIALTFPNLEKYIPLLRRAFGQYDIPYNLSTGMRLRQSPLIQNFLRCLKVIESGFEYRNTLELLNSPFLKMDSKVNLYRLYSVLIEKRMRYLTERWDERLLKSMKENERGKWGKSIQQIVQILTPLYRAPADFTADEFRHYFIGLLRQLGFLDWYATENKQLSPRRKESEFRAFNRFMKQFERFIWALRHTDPQARYSLSEISAKLSASLARIDYNLSEWPDYGVQIMPRLEIQAMEYERLILGGLVDGEFPRSSGRDVFFNDKAREKLGLLASEELLHQDRFIFYSLLESNAREILLTFPRYEEDRALVASTFIAGLQDACGVAADTGPVVPEEEPPFDRKRLNLGLAIQKNHLDEEARTAVSAILDERPAEREELLFVIRRILTGRHRLSGNKYTVYEGNLEGQSTALAYIQKKFKRRVWSASALEEYAFCPMQFFLRRLLKAEELPEMEDGLSGLERGSAVHEILFKFYSFLRENKAENRPADFYSDLLRIGQEVFDKLPVKGFFKQLEYRLMVGSPEQPGLLLRLLEKDQRVIVESGYRPAYLEWSFGHTGARDRDPHSLPKAVRLNNARGELSLTGSIDRVDLDDQGNALIIDYKTGSTAEKIKLDAILQGLHLQLPLYTLTFQKNFQNRQAVWAGYYLLGHAEKIRRHPLMINGDIFEANKKNSALLPSSKWPNEDGQPLTFGHVLDIALVNALKIVESINKGYFGLSPFPEEITCQQYCDYKRICQKNTAKMKRVKEE